MFLEEIKLSQASTQVLRRDPNALGNLRLVCFWVLFLIVNEADKGISFGHFCTKSPFPLSVGPLRERGLPYPFPTTVAL